MKLSIVSTLYKSAPHIDEFHRRLSEEAQQLTSDYEIILVNDGSPDESREKTLTIIKNDPHLKLIDLSRNFGHHKAIMTGLNQAKGEVVFLIDSDLEEAPEWLSLFMDRMQTEDCDVIYGVQEKRKGGLFERCSGAIFYTLFKKLSGLEMPANVVTARLMKRRYVESLTSFEEREIFLAGLWHLTGFDQRPQVITKLSTSTTSYRLRDKLSLFVNSITSFSNLPLIGIFYFGLTISMGASIYIVYLVIQKLFWAQTLSGWTSVMASIWLLGGISISIVGILGIYLAKIFSETKQRPYTIIKGIYEQPPE